MWIVDYLICNNDRHFGNYGMYYNADTMEIIRMHPLFDHNKAFNDDVMYDRNITYKFNGMPMRDAAHEAMKNVDFHFDLDIIRSDFISNRHYTEFMVRAKELGIKTEINSTWKTFCKKNNINLKRSSKAFERIHDRLALSDSYLFYDIIKYKCL